MYKVASAAGRQQRNDLSRRSGQVFHHASSFGYADGTTAQHHHPFAGVRPVFHPENSFEGLASDHNRIDGSDEFVVPWESSGTDRVDTRQV